MLCKFCTLSEELMWAENYKPGDKPVKTNGQPHICLKDKHVELGEVTRKGTERCNICGKEFTNEWKAHLHRV